MNAENSDDITALDLHRSRSNILLAGGDDGQLSMFDTNIADEDDSLLQGVSHGPIHKAGFLGSDRFFALSSDQNFSVYPVSSPGDQEDPEPTVFGDLRPLIPCEYVINVFESGEGYAVAAGSNIKWVINISTWVAFWLSLSDQRVNIVELRHAKDPQKQPKLKPKSGYILEGAHGEEIVRSIIADEAVGRPYHVIWTTTNEFEKTGTIFTAGEDGSIKAFNIADEGVQQSTVKTTKMKRPTESRYKPY